MGNSFEWKDFATNPKIIHNNKSLADKRIALVICI